jgi:phage terminase Nu1 subunit (DNA packaging protein)
MSQDIFTQMVEKWRSPFVANSKFGEFSGGLITGKTLQNYASQGLPVPESVKIGNKRAWIASSAANWLRNRYEEGRAA